MKREIVNKQIFLEELPRWRFGKGQPKGVIDWINCIGYKVKFIYGDIEGVLIIHDIYKNKKSIILVLSYNNKTLHINKTNFLNTHIGELLKTRTKGFKIEIGTIFKNEKRNITILNREYRVDSNNIKRKYYEYHCNIDDNVNWIEENNLLKGKGCPICSNNKVAQGINDIPTTAPEMIKYFQGGYDEAKFYTQSSSKKIIPICPDCGRVKKKEMLISTIYAVKSIGCTCSDSFSYGHKYMFNLLTQLNLDFIDNHKFDWCKFYNPFKNKDTTGEYDFVIEDLKLIIEVDGGFHRKDNTMSGQTKEESEYLDDMKDRLADENGYDVVRISDEESIKDNILASDLINLFDLYVINWNECEEFALSNLCKKICELKRDNYNLTTTQIGELMKLSSVTVVNYLKRGTKIWDWCNYNAKEEKLKGSSKSGKMRGKQVEIFKEGELLSTFPSTYELERQSEELFGVKLLRGNISAVCNGEAKCYKGYTFKYI